MANETNNDAGAKPAPIQAEERKPYRTPEIRSLGGFRERTLQGGSFAADANHDRMPRA